MSTIFHGGERGICGCRHPVTNIGDRASSNWVHDHASIVHRPFAISAVTR